MALKLALTNLPIFQFLDAEALSALSGIGKVVEKHQGEAILMQGEPVPGVYVVGEGMASVFASGVSRPLADLRPGDSFGEMSFVERTTASATIRAGREGARFAVFMHTDLEGLTSSVPGFGQALYRGIALTLSKKLRAMTEQVSHELEAGKALLQQLDAQNSAAPQVELLSGAIDAQVQGLLSAVDGSVTKLNELSRRIPDKAGSFGEVSLPITEARTKVRAGLPSLLDQVKVLANVVVRMEAFVLRNPHS